MNLHLSSSNDGSEDPDETQELVRVVVVNGVLQPDVGDPEQEGSTECQHVTNEPIFAWKVFAPVVETWF